MGVSSALLLALLAGCYHGIEEDCLASLTCGDLSFHFDAGPADSPPVEIALTHDYVTLRVGETFDFRSVGECTGDQAPCTYSWEFGDGRTSTERNPGKLAYDKTGFYNVRLTVTPKTGSKAVRNARFAVWDGTFSDSFERSALDKDKQGWRGPLTDNPEAAWKLVDNSLQTTGDLALPGSTALLTWVSARDQHIEVTIKRCQKQDEDHFSDIILRMHPLRLSGRFYRVRIYEEMGPGHDAADDGIEIAIFRITNPKDEHGILLNDEVVPATDKPTQCTACPYVGAYPRNQDLKVIVDLVGATFDVRVEDPNTPGTAVLTSKATDPEDQLLYSGFSGLTHFMGLTRFDDFSLVSKDK